VRTFPQNERIDLRSTLGLGYGEFRTDYRTGTRAYHALAIIPLFLGSWWQRMQFDPSNRPWKSWRQVVPWHRRRRVACTSDTEVLERGVWRSQFCMSACLRKSCNWQMPWVARWASSLFCYHSYFQSGPTRFHSFPLMFRCSLRGGANQRQMPILVLTQETSQQRRPNRERKPRRSYPAHFSNGSIIGSE
jgi:hypothetical protein